MDGEIIKGRVAALELRVSALEARDGRSLGSIVLDLLRPLIQAAGAVAAVAALSWLGYGESAARLLAAWLSG